jgi:glucose-1-phosphate thymidylyltransferase
VANKPVLSYGLEAIRGAGITDAGMIVEHVPAIQAAAGVWSQRHLYQAGGSPRPWRMPSVLVARDYLGEDDFVMYLGDNVIVGGITALVDSKIEYSIVLPRASIRRVRRIEASIIGREVEVTPAPRVPGLTDSFSAVTLRCR